MRWTLVILAMGCAPVGGGGTGGADAARRLDGGGQDTGTGDATPGGDAAPGDAMAPKEDAPADGAPRDGASFDGAAVDGSATDGAGADAARGDGPIAPPDAGGGVRVTFRVAVPPNTPDEPVHLVGDFQGWDPTDEDHAMADRADGTRELTVELPAGRAIEFKFARGAWERVEKGAGGEEIENRRHVVGDDDETVHLRVARWVDGVPSTAVGDVRTVVVPDFLGGRRVWLYLPPGYEGGEARYPVLYMFDGQNVFDHHTSFSGEWGVDEALEQGIGAGEVAPMIVVAVDNAGADRFNEYTPWDDAERVEVGGGGDAHLDAWVEVLVPWVDAHLRTRAERASRGLAGSSLGGLMSAYAAFTRAATFGRFGALSPSIWVDERHLLRVVEESPAPAGARLWVDTGGLEERPEDFAALRALLEAHDEIALHAEVFPDGGHDEPSWHARFPAVLRFLYPPEGG